MTRSEAIRSSLLSSAARLKHGRDLAAEAAALEADEADREEMLAVASLMASLRVVIVAPTSHGARSASFRPETAVAGDTTRVLVEQLGAVDAQRLGDRVGYLSADELWSIDDALLTVLGLT